MPWDSMQRTILILHLLRGYTPHLYQYANALVRKPDGFSQILYLIKFWEFFCNPWGHFQIPYSVT